VPSRKRSLRFLLDENLSRRVGELLAEVGLPVLWVGGPDAPPRGASDVEIVRWCGRTGVVWVTFDRGIKKDRAIYDAVMHHGVSVFLIPSKGMTVRDYLLLLLLGFQRHDWERKVAESSEPMRRRVGKTGQLRKEWIKRPRA
jgi:hypothetical protein